MIARCCGPEMRPIQSTSSRCALHLHRGGWPGCCLVWQTRNYGRKLIAPACAEDSGGALEVPAIDKQQSRWGRVGVQIGWTGCTVGPWCRCLVDGLQQTRARAIAKQQRKSAVCPVHDRLNFSDPRTQLTRPDLEPDQDQRVRNCEREEAKLAPKLPEDCKGKARGSMPAGLCTRSRQTGRSRSAVECDDIASDVIGHKAWQSSERHCARRVACWRCLAGRPPK